MVDIGLGEENTFEELLSVLEAKNITEAKYRKVVAGVVEILWGSFWGAAEDELSYDALKTVLVSSNLKSLPVLTPFKFSRYIDGSGWGDKVSQEDRDFWRASFNHSEHKF